MPVCAWVCVWPTGQVANGFGHGQLIKWGERKRSLKYLQLGSSPLKHAMHRLLSRDVSRHCIEIPQVSLELSAWHVTHCLTIVACTQLHFVCNELEIKVNALKFDILVLKCVYFMFWKFHKKLCIPVCLFPCTFRASGCLRAHKYAHCDHLIALRHRPRHRASHTQSTVGDSRNHSHTQPKSEPRLSDRETVPAPEPVL